MEERDQRVRALLVEALRLLGGFRVASLVELAVLLRGAIHRTRPRSARSWPVRALRVSDQGRRHSP